MYYSQPKPNLFIVGAMKAGTSSLHEYLAEHPDIFMSTPKEPSHFSQQISYSKGDQHYLNLFKNAKGYQVIGESSTQYAKAPRIQGVPERIHDFNPEAKIIYIMRDPIERAISHYWFNWRNHGEKRSMLNAFKQDSSYIDFSHYAMQLFLYAKVFDWSRIKVLTTEELNTNSISTIQDIYKWLGVNDQFVPSTQSQKFNVTPQKVFRGNKTSHFTGSFLKSKFYNNIRSYIPDAFRMIGRTIIQEQADKKQASLEEVEYVVPYLQSVMLEQVKDLEVILERDFLVWETLYSQG